MPTIEQLSAMEILDSRGRPTVSATCRLAGGVAATASVPSGASTGRAEALELRDGDPRRYGGLGCRNVVGHVNREINTALAGRSFAAQADLDRALIDLDGTANKSKLGANAILAVSLAFARAAAAAAGLPLYRHFADILGETLRTLPRLTVNLFSGGKHAGEQVAIQDVLVVPAGAQTIDKGLATVYAVYQAAAKLTHDKYGMRALTADEGGLAPAFASDEAMLQDAVAAIRAAGFEPGREVALAVDVASSHFYRDGRYHLAGGSLDSGQMINHLRDWVRRYPIVSVEDGLAEDDWNHWPALRREIGGEAPARNGMIGPAGSRSHPDYNQSHTGQRRSHTGSDPTGGVLVLGDDLLCTNPQRIRRAIETDAATALLLKVNQIGTVTEAAEALRLARSAGWHITISARSGETEDNWLADLAVGWAGEQIKVGSITQSERLAKYNRLLAIEAQTRLPVVGWPGDRIG
ncbi:MAG: phosphopyruvate hydratase [Planctomycetes bacterium]|nr:phosphopyruvate hydratase [Planctomycetota bacterium]